MRTRFAIVGTALFILAAPAARADPPWKFLGPTNASGRISALAPYPNSTTEILAGSAGGGIYTSTNAGKGWNRLQLATPMPTFGSITALALPSNGTLYVGSGSGGRPTGAGYDDITGVGLAVTHDGGFTWKTYPYGTGFFAISPHPNDESEVVVAGQQALYRLTHYGATVKSKVDLICMSLARDKKHPERLYAVCSGGPQQLKRQIVRSLDSGQTWNPAPDPTHALKGPIITLAINPSNPSEIIAAAQADPQSGPKVMTLFHSTNGGDSWQLLHTATVGSDRRAVVAAHLIISPQSATTILMGEIGYARTQDSGKTWTEVLQPVHADLRAFAWLDNTLLLATDGGVYATTDMGKTFVARSKGLDTAQFFRIASEPDPKHPNRMFATAQDIGTWRRSDAGDTLWSMVSDGDGWLGLMPDPTHKEMLVFLTPWGSHGSTVVQRTANDAAAHPTVKAVDPFPIDSSDIGVGIGRMADKPSKGNALYEIYFGDAWVSKSIDDGSHWKLIGKPSDDPTAANPSLSDKGSWRVSALAAARTDSGSHALLVAKGRIGASISKVYYSTDLGQSFKTAKGAPKSLIVSLAVSPQGRAFLATMDRSGLPVHCSTDGGASWSACSNGLPSGRFGRAVAVDPIFGNTIYAGTDLGFYRSSDYGAHWYPFGTGLPACAVNDIEVQKSGAFLRIGTLGCGAWQIALPLQEAIGQHKKPPPSGATGVAK